MVIGPFFIAIGAGLLYTVSREISSAKLIGYQILLGVGIGMTVRPPPPGALDVADRVSRSCKTASSRSSASSPSLADLCRH